MKWSTDWQRGGGSKMSAPLTSGLIVRWQFWPTKIKWRLFTPFFTFYGTQPLLDGLGLVRWFGWAFADPANETCSKEKGGLAELIQLSATSKQIGGSGKKKKLKGSAHFQQTLLFSKNKLRLSIFISVSEFSSIPYYYLEDLTISTMEWPLH